MKYFVKAGERHHRLVVLATHQRVEGKRGFYNFCRCDCGKECYRTSTELVRGGFKSCGCAYREAQKRGNFIHGGTHRRADGRVRFEYLYGFWLRSRSRTLNPEDEDYPDYGGRGIILATSWQKSYAPFRDWIEKHLGPRPSLGYRLERWDREKGVEPGNLLWVTGQQQYALRTGLVLAL